MLFFSMEPKPHFLTTRSLISERAIPTGHAPRSIPINGSSKSPSHLLRKTKISVLVGKGFVRVVGCRSEGERGSKEGNGKAALEAFVGALILERIPFHAVPAQLELVKWFLKL